MSYAKKDQVFPSQRDEKIRLSIAHILRDEFSATSSAMKIIAKRIHANPRGVKNWYQGEAAPNLSHFISLASISPSLMCWFLRITGYVDLARRLELKTEGEVPPVGDMEFCFYGIIFDTKKIRGGLTGLQSLNQRQVWFYAEVHKGGEPTAHSHARYWGVGVATARRDIALLVDLGLIHFSGAKKNGRYAVGSEAQ
jgi:hypothetical protein